MNLLDIKSFLLSEQGKIFVSILSVALLSFILFIIFFRFIIYRKLAKKIIEAKKVLEQSHEKLDNKKNQMKALTGTKQTPYH